ncbi:hypothetical protein KPL74_03930 [Bacillus sp. NP157]|nr:hypothetical protein KPL74_03930 [Bacillus sp. NP157]
MSGRRIAFGLYGVVSALVCAYFIYVWKPLWILFGGMAAYFVFRAFRPSPAQGRRVVEAGEPAVVAFGRLGMYAVDGDREQALGMYIRLGGRAVFIDIAQDGLLDGRIAYAHRLYAATDVLEAGLGAFVQANREFAGRRVGTIGLHSRKDAEQGEVFWDPDGYTLLKGTTFVS